MIHWTTPDLNIWQRFLIKNYTLLNPEQSRPKLTTNFFLQFQSHWSLNINLHPRGTRVHGLRHWRKSKSSLWFFSRPEQSPGVGREVKKVFIILSCQPWQWKPHCVQHKVMALPPHMAVEFSEEWCWCLVQVQNINVGLQNLQTQKKPVLGKPFVLSTLPQDQFLPPASV